MLRAQWGHESGGRSTQVGLRAIEPRFMGGEHLPILDVNRDHEPGCRSADFSPLHGTLGMVKRTKVRAPVRGEPLAVTAVVARACGFSY